MSRLLIGSLIAGLLCVWMPVAAHGGPGRGAAGGRAGKPHPSAQGAGAKSVGPPSEPSNGAARQSHQQFHATTPKAGPANGFQHKPAGFDNAPGMKSNPSPRAGNMAARGEKTNRSGEKAGSRMSETQQQNVNKLLSDLKDIKSGSQVTPEQKQQLKNDLMAMADGAQKPSQASVSQLATDLQAAWSDQKLTPVEQKKLMADVTAVFTSANIPASEVQATVIDAQAILTASGVTKEDAVAIANDLKAIATELKNNVPASP